jgi:hypothetical protein
MKTLAAWLALCSLAAAPAVAKCIPYNEAPKRVGDSVCITGKVLKVSRSAKSGTHFLNFCDDYRDCPFSVVVFARDLDKVGDVEWLEGKEIEIHGRVKEYKGQAEIVLNDVRQLSGGAAKLPPLPKNYDAAYKGKYSAGQFSTTGKKQTQKKPKKERGATDQPDEPDDK